jgi:Fic family protein
MELQNLLQRIDELKAELDALLPMDPVQHDRLWQKLRLEWNYNSNHIEGNTLTYGETFLLLVHGKTAGDHSVREIDEMRAHNVAINVVREWADEKERPLREADIRDLNKLLLKEPFWKSARTADGQETSTHILPGEYKKEGNGVMQSDGTMFHYARPEEVPAKMMDLMDWFNAQGQEHHPLLVATEWHHRFILIHPFGDGNGRVARLIVNQILMRAGYMPLVVRSADKGQYLTALKKADAGDLNPFAEYLAKQEIWALELALRVAHGGEPEERGDWVKEAHVAYARAADNKQKADALLQIRKERIQESLRLNMPLLLIELNLLISSFRPFYKTFEGSVEAEQKSGRSFLDMKLSLRAFELDQLQSWFDKLEMKPMVRFVLNFKGDKLDNGALPAMVVLTWHFDEDVQRFSCSRLTQEPPSELAYGLSIQEYPLVIIEKIGKWVLQRSAAKKK